MAILIGDIVVSGKTPGWSVSVPTIGSTSEVFGSESGCGFIDTPQKVVICSDHLALACARRAGGGTEVSRSNIGASDAYSRCRKPGNAP